MTRLTSTPTAALAATGLIAGYGVAVASGSRPAGGAVLVAAGLPCIAIWSRRHSPATTAKLTAAGLVGFAASHALGLAIGAWPAVLVTAAAVGALYWFVSDAPRAQATASSAPKAGTPASTSTHG
jgi:hypothetical protein